MQGHLENYLSEVAAQLSTLPTKRRNEELREIRAHLENAVTVNRGTGQTEDEAARNAVIQFGTPQDLGDNLVWAWQREKKLDKRGLYATAAYTFAVLFFLSNVWAAGSALTAGVICGGFLSKRGFAGTALGAAVYYYGFGGSVFVYTLTRIDLRLYIEPVPHVTTGFFVQQTEHCLMTLLIAWTVNRWRLRRARLRLARN